MATTTTRPPLEDPLNEREIFVNDVAAVGETGGNITVTFANIRGDIEPPKMRRIVRLRLVLTQVAASQLINSLQQLAAQIKKEAAAGANIKPN